MKRRFNGYNKKIANAVMNRMAVEQKFMRVAMRVAAILIESSIPVQEAFKRILKSIKSTCGVIPISMSSPKGDFFTVRFVFQTNDSDCIKKIQNAITSVCEESPLMEKGRFNPNDKSLTLTFNSLRTAKELQIFALSNSVMTVTDDNRNNMDDWINKLDEKNLKEIYNMTYQKGTKNKTTLKKLNDSVVDNKKDLSKNFTFEDLKKTLKGYFKMNPSEFYSNALVTNLVR